MAKKRTLHPAAEPFKFKKGQSGNPNGRPPLNPVQRALKNLTIETYREVIELALTGNLDALKEMAQNPKTSAIQVGVATAILKSIKEGDPTVLEKFAERIVGKIPEVIHVTANSTNLNANVAMVADKELKERIKKLKSDV